MLRTDRTPIVGLAAIALATFGCVNDDGSRSSDDANGTGDIVVFAAASLGEVFSAVGIAFEDANPGIDVSFNVAASSELATQIGEGASADVFASADPTSIAGLADSGRLDSEPVVFAVNALQIVVESGNPSGVAGVADLADPDLVVLSCAPQVPCGRYTEQMLDRAGVVIEFDSYEENVRAVTSKVALGEADAGIVYVTDVLAAGDRVRGVEIPAEFNVVANHSIVTVGDSSAPATARAFVDFVLSQQGQSILASYGFAAP